MFMCNFCEKTFEEPIEIPNDTACPHCKSPDYSEAYLCDACGEYCTDYKYDEATDRVFCPDCAYSEQVKLSPRAEYERMEFLLGWDSICERSQA